MSNDEEHPTVSNEEEEDEHHEDCPICLDSMSESDFEHPLQCTRKCGYNFCLTCIESLITSSKDDYAEASDGNRHVKVFLHCPNCRSDLGPTIRDTVLLRKVHALSVHCEQGALSESEARLQQVINDPEIQSAIQGAYTREAKFFNVHFQRDDEMGVEADIASGVHRSFRCYEKEKQQVVHIKRTIDPTLFQGLESAMTQEEQMFVTQLYTSGDTKKLATAAELMHDITVRLHQGIIPKQATTNMNRSRRSSIYDLIAESKQVNQETTTAVKTASRYEEPLSKIKAAQHKAIDREISQHQRYMREHPLPVRMPKFVEFNLADPGHRSFLPFFSGSRDTRPVTFCDDVWDGTVVDAFSKITISGGNPPTVTKKSVEEENRGVFRVVDAGGSRVISDEPQPRVLVASVRSEAGRQGVLKGDVVTHFNGEEFNGVSEDLEKAIAACVGGTITLILNAERSIAEALKRRSMI